MKPANPVRVLFVCLGNICRSPAAEGAFLHLLESENLIDRFIVDSCGTAGYHVGELSNVTTRKVAKENGIELVHRARKFEGVRDFDTFDYLLVMDQSNYQDVVSHARNDADKAKVFLFRDYESDFKNSRGKGVSVPDPYYGGINEFREVQDIVMRTSRGFLNYLKLTKAL
ncbi:MAG: low molecular weight phosphotyrosine protein phosphatase [Leptospira sp.]|nr:low molecular weight phosphotyrosine protein phosphatase [Leptospira sp.]